MARWRLRLVFFVRHFLEVPSGGVVAALIAEEIFEERQARRRECDQLREALVRLTGEVQTLSNMVKMMTLWVAKHDVEALNAKIGVCD